MRWSVEDEIMKYSIINKIRKLIENNENNATETLNTIKALIASESKPDFTKIKDGEHFTYKGIEFIRLGKEQGGIFCLTAKIWKTLQFDKDGCNNFKKAFICKVLNNEFRPLLDDNDLLIYQMDLTADNGDKAYGSLYVHAGLLSADLYRKYRDYIPSYNDLVWLCTPWHCSNNASNLRTVGTGGALHSSGAYYAYGVVPAVIFKEDLCEKNFNRN